MCFSVGDAYRLYNLDVYGYQIHDKMGIYGSVPYLLAHKQGRTVAVFWLNASETLVEINTEPAVEVSHGMWLHAIVTILQSVRAPFFNSSIFLWPRALQCNWQMSVGATKCRQIHLEQGPIVYSEISQISIASFSSTSWPRWARQLPNKRSGVERMYAGCQRAESLMFFCWRGLRLLTSSGSTHPSQVLAWRLLGPHSLCCVCPMYQHCKLIFVLHYVEITNNVPMHFK